MMGCLYALRHQQGIFCAVCIEVFRTREFRNKTVEKCIYLQWCTHRPQVVIAPVHPEHFVFELNNCLCDFSACAHPHAAFTKWGGASSTTMRSR